MSKIKLSVKENQQEAFEMEAEEGDQVHLGEESYLEVSTIADGNAMLHFEGVVVKEAGQSTVVPEPLDMHIGQGDSVVVTSADGSSWTVTLTATLE